MNGNNKLFQMQTKTLEKGMNECIENDEKLIVVNATLKNSKGVARKNGVGDTLTITLI